MYLLQEQFSRVTRGWNDLLKDIWESMFSVSSIPGIALATFGSVSEVFSGGQVFNVEQCVKDISVKVMWDVCLEVF